VYKNFWRVREKFGTQEDAIQECIVIFLKCADRYAGTVDNARWFMSLYTQSVHNAWVNAAKASTKSGGSVSFDAATTLVEALYPQAADATLATSIAECGAEVADAFMTIVNAPGEFAEFFVGKHRANYRINGVEPAHINTIRDILLPST